MSDDIILRANGKPLEQKHYDAFESWCAHNFNAKATAQTICMNANTLCGWVSSDWWKKLVEKYVASASRKFYMQMSARSDEIINSYFDIVNGKDKNDKTANARIQGIKAYMEAGKHPIINRRNDVNINNNTQINTVSIDMQQAHEMSATELLEAARTGQVPHRLKVINEVKENTI